MRNKKGISPVIATIIMVAVAIVISIAAAFWLTGLMTSFQTYENLAVTSSYSKKIGTTYYLCLNISNPGPSDVTIIGLIVNNTCLNSSYITNNVRFDNTTPTLPYTLAAGKILNIQIQLASPAFKPKGGIYISAEIVTSQSTYRRDIRIP